MFRSMADQLLGRDEENHLKLRKEVADYLKANKEKYGGFIEDEKSFDDYCET